MPYLFQVSLGPVQTFIKGARRTRDLKFSSSFLSELARIASRIISRKCGDTSLIFPALSSGELEDVPNKILAYVEADILPDQLAQLIKIEIDEEVKRIRDEMFRKIGQGRFDHVGAEQQITDLVEYIWAAVRYDGQKDSYSDSRQRLEALIAARKNTRDFARVAWGSSQPKSSMDGYFESVIFEGEYPHLKNIKAMNQIEKLEVSQKINVLRKSFDAGPHEKLSGVDLLKRLGMIHKEEKTFPSTSHMAALPFLTGLNTLPEDKLQKVTAWKEQYINNVQKIDIALLKRSDHPILFTLDALPEEYYGNKYWGKIYSLGKYDGALLFPERFPNIVGDAQIFQEAREQFQKASRILDDFLQEIEMRPDPYYTLLVADGDSMGKVINAQAKMVNGMQRHKDLSAALATFAVSVRETIEQHAGVRIYSGGDDVLALLPLHTAVQCASALASKFREALANFKNDEQESPTLSIGLAIVHHLHPLGDALDIARQAEGRAKNGEKNALAITVQKRGGPPCKVGGRWSKFDQRLNCQSNFCQQGIIPSSMAYELEEIALRLESAQGEKAEVSPPYVQYAALRVFQRKLDEAGRREKNKKAAALALYALKRMIGLIGLDKGASETPEQGFKVLRKMSGLQDEDVVLLDELRKQVKSFDQFQVIRVEELANELVVARFFADARRLANGGNNEQGAKV